MKKATGCPLETVNEPETVTPGNVKLITPAYAEGSLEKTLKALTVDMSRENDVGTGMRNRKIRRMMTAAAMMDLLCDFFGGGGGT